MTALPSPSQEPLRLRAVPTRSRQARTFPATHDIELSGHATKQGDIIGLVLLDGATNGPRLARLADRLRRAGWPVLLCEADSPTAPAAPCHADVVSSLTRRERQILSMVAQGLTNQEIARELYISVNTLKTHIRAAYQKIGVERRTQAVTWCYEHLPHTGPDLRLA